MDENLVDDAEGMPDDERINISDVIEVIETTDPDFKQSTMFNGGGEIQQAPIMQQHAPHFQQSRRRAYVKIIEQPASKALRFRYECEGRSAGSIPGASSTPENKTFPSIQVVGYQGRAVVVVSCVTKDEPYRPHPHNLVGRDGCKKGVCTLEISPETMTVTFSNLGIQCVKKKDIESALKVREEIKVDPFMTGFSHRNQPTSIDLNAVRLCFQVFLEGERKGKFTVPLTPVVSDTIYDKKAMSDLVICRLSHCNSYVDGPRNEIILLCEKVAKDDISVRFYEEKDGEVIWEDKGDFQPSEVHKQTAIVFRPPKYHNQEITEPVKVYIQLQRPSDGAKSEPLPFQFLPRSSDPAELKRKRQKLQNPALFKSLAGTESNLPQSYNFLNIPTNEIKVEPRDKAPSPYGGHVYNTLSPGYPSPQSITPQPIDATAYLLQPQYQQQASTSYAQQQQNQLPPIGNMMQQANQAMASWNLPIERTDVDNATGLSLYNLDNQQMEFKPLELNSSDLNFESAALSETFNQNLSLCDIGDANMSDSLTKLANKALEEM